MTAFKKNNAGIRSLLSSVFFLSGFASLIYQVVWQRLLTVYYGVGSISITLIVSVYMLGLGIGALIGGYLAERVKNKLGLYLLVELSTGCFGIISLPFLDWLGRNTAASSPFASFFYMFLFLCLPTILMGITLPLITKIFNSFVRDFLKTVSFLYFINTLGAAVGTIFASLVLISFFGLDSALYVAAGINVGLAVLIYIGGRLRTAPEPGVAAVGAEPAEGSIFGRVAFLLVFLTGFLAVGYEIVWFRLIAVLVKASPYAFSCVLSVYLFGVALGSFLMNRYLSKTPAANRKRLFFSLQFLIGLYVAVVIIAFVFLTKHSFLGGLARTSFLTEVHPVFKLPSLESAGAFFKDLYALSDILLWPAFLVFVPTLLMGASFPLISALALTRRDREGKTVGTVYFFNIIGNTLGGVLTGYVLLPLLGTELTLKWFAVAGLAFGLLVHARRTPSINPSSKGVPRAAGLPRYALVGAAIAATLWLFPGRTRLYEMIHHSPFPGSTAQIDEGIDTVVVSYEDQDKLEAYIGGQGHGRRPGYNYYWETMEAVSFPRRLENVLIIGFGTGSITEAMLKTEGVERITIVEISRSLMKNLTRRHFFKEMLSDPRITLIIDDGRRFLLKSDAKYDLILMDPLKSSTSYSTNLYSFEFFSLISRRLNEEGVFFAWTDEFRVMPKTVRTAFNHVRVYDYFCLASNDPWRETPGRREKLLENLLPRESWHLVRQKSQKYLGGDDYIIKVSRGYPINRDRRPVSEYYLGLKVRSASLEKQRRG